MTRSVYQINWQYFR